MTSGEKGAMADIVLVPKSEFHVADMLQYDRSSPLRWLTSHLLQYKRLIISYMTSSFFVAILYSAIPVVIGHTFDNVLQSSDGAALLLNLAGTVVLMVLLRCVGDLIDVFSIETL